MLQFDVVIFFGVEAYHEKTVDLANMYGYLTVTQDIFKRCFVYESEYKN
jgi:hypothetical protein